MGGENWTMSQECYCKLIHKLPTLGMHTGSKGRMRAVG